MERSPIRQSGSTTEDWGLVTLSELARFAVTHEDLPQGPGHRVVVSVGGEIDISNADELERTIMQAWETGHQDVVVDLSQVEFMGSAGISALILAANPVRRDGGEVTLRKPSAVVRRLFGVMGVDMAFPIDD
jgi:anti-sigma B factor antagonist